MALVIENGSCVSAANAYVDISYVSAYLLGEQAEAWEALSEPEQESAIIKATRAVDTLYDWQGTRKTLEQALSWPRSKVSYEGFKIEGVPVAVKKATAEAVGLFLDGAEFFSNEADMKIASERVDVISVSYQASRPSDTKAPTKFEALNRILRNLFLEDTGSGGLGISRVERV